MRKKFNFLALLAVAALAFNSFATINTYAADDDEEDVDVTEYSDDLDDVDDVGAKPMYYYEDMFLIPPIIHNFHYFKDLDQVVDWYAAYCIQTLGESNGFKGVVKENAQYKPSKGFSRRQVKKIVKNLFGYNLKISNPDKRATSKWLDKALNKVAKKKYGINYNIRYATLLNKGKIDRIDVAIAVFELYVLATGGDLPPF